MKCDRCREQLPVGDGIDHHGQILSLACYTQGAASSMPTATLYCLDLFGSESERAVQMSLMNT